MADADQFAPIEPAGPAEEPSGATLAALGVSLTLAACGGGGGGGGGGAGMTPTPPAAILPTKIQAARFLSQASMGSSRTDIDQVAAQGFDAWLDAQFAMPRQTSHWDWLVAGGFATAATMNSQAGFDPVMWRQLIASPDQLRARVGMALLDFLVVGIDGVNVPWRQFAVAAYLDVLLDNAFGNFRTLMQAISTNVAMGYYLTFAGNRKANPATGSVPDENYARELMQLFTIGLLKLNPDGSVQANAGVPIETYTQDDITGLARVFTGWNLANADNTTPDRMRLPMTNNAALHETGVKTFLGTTIPAGTAGPQSLTLALDAIFNHANVAPFVCKQLIQRLVTSNPAPAYVGRVAAVFANNGAGVRGDLKAVIRAILTDVEARSDAIAGASSAGKLREPIMRLTGWARAFGATSPSGAWPIGDTSSTSTRLGQSPGRSPSVFNFFRPGYTPPNSAIATAGLVAPEFQITNEPSVIAYVNYMAALLSAGSGDFRADYTAISALAADSLALLDEVDLLLGAALSAGTKASIRAAIDSIAFGSANGPIFRVYTAILLTLGSPEYLVQK
ncbi:MAG: hypothetical protein QOJ53_640 [Sphingomonadales bacterium]|jgi:uncharacterized protein (DUF1800 family)|nr:hypothetical protein [Sphingomonadales bacterium]MEA3046308.1 hypothetical protein [Sphingomonadales bacterium]